MKLKILFIMLIICLHQVSAATVDLIKTDPSPPEAGEYVDITVRLNLDNDVFVYEGLSFYFEDSKFIQFLSPPKTYSRANPGEELTATFQLFVAEETPQGEVNLEARLQRDGFLEKFTVPMYVEESDSKPDILIGNLKTTPSRVLPDTDDNELVMSLNNLGDREAELMVAEIIPRNEDFRESFTYSLRDSLASIPGGESGDLTFYFDVEVEKPTTLLGDLKLTYRIPNDGSSESERVETQIPIEIPITNTPFLELKKVEQLSPFTSGSVDNILELTIVNTGNKDAEDVRVRLYPDVTFPFSFDRTTRYVLADLEPGKETKVRFEIEVFSTASVLDYPLAVELESLVGTSRYTREETLTLSVAESKRSDIPTPVIVIGAIILVSIIIAIFQARNRRKSKKKK